MHVFLSFFFGGSSSEDLKISDIHNIFVTGFAKRGLICAIINI